MSGEQTPWEWSPQDRVPPPPRPNTPPPLPPTSAGKALGWWAISGDALLDGLRRCAAGEDPDLVYAEMYANSDVEQR